MGRCRRLCKPYVNMFEKVDSLNEVITKLNQPLGYTSQTSFEFLGQRGHKRTSDGQEVAEREHMLYRWREFDKGPARCLHLDDKLRVVAFNKVISHISYRLESKDSSKHPELYYTLSRRITWRTWRWRYMLRHCA